MSDLEVTVKGKAAKASCDLNKPCGSRIPKSLSSDQMITNTATKGLGWNISLTPKPEPTFYREDIQPRSRCG